MTVQYDATQPERAPIDKSPGAVLLDFGTNWCGHCRAAQAHVDKALATHQAVRHIKVEDGPGRALGRAYGVKVWPTLVFLRDGKEMARLVRPVDGVAIAQALALIDSVAD